MMPFEFNLKTRLKFKIGGAKDLASVLKELGFERPGLIVDGAIKELPYIQEVLDNVRNAGFLNVKIWFYNLKGEPDYEMLDNNRAEFVDEADRPLVDCFVGIGGGSVLDTAKGFATLVVNPGPAMKYCGFPKDIQVPLPVIALPTTAGTGSEVTYNASFIDRISKKKMGINTTYNFPRVAIIDPLLVSSCPRSVAISSGIDALVHTMESYVAVGSNIVTRTYAKEAFSLLFNNILQAISDMSNVDLVAKLQLGAYFAGISLFNAGSGIAGALSYPLGVHFNVPHGMAGAVFLAPIIKYNVGKGYDYSELYDLIDNVDRGLTKEEKNIRFTEKMFVIADALNIPHTLSSFGVTKENIEILINDVDNLEKAFAQNPIPFSKDQGKDLLRTMV